MQEQDTQKYCSGTQSLAKHSTVHPMNGSYRILMRNVPNVCMMRCVYTVLYVCSHLLLFLLLLSHLFQANLLGLFSFLGFSLKMRSAKYLIKGDVAAE